MEDKARKDSLMSFGFDCGDGWYPVMDALMLSFNNLYENTGMLVRPQQVKQKFGTLRIYYKAAYDLSKVRRTISPIYGLLYYCLICPIAALLCRIPCRFFLRRPYLRYRLSNVKSDIYSHRLFNYTRIKKYSWAISGWEDEAKPEKLDASLVRGILRGIVTMAEDLSSVICEECGVPGELRGKLLWKSVMCDKCFKKKGDKKNG